jgi:hypothetical protein
MNDLLAVRRWAVSEHVGAGPLTFGMSRPEVRSHFVEESKELPFDGEPMDSFNEVSVLAQYDSGRLVRLRFYDPAQVYFRQFELVGMRAKQALKELDQLAERVDLYGFDFYSALGIGLVRGERNIKAVDVYHPSYYQNLIDRFTRARRELEG